MSKPEIKKDTKKNYLAVFVHTCVSPLTIRRNSCFFETREPLPHLNTFYIPNRSNEADSSSVETIIFGTCLLNVYRFYLIPLQSYYFVYISGILKDLLNFIVSILTYMFNHYVDKDYEQRRMLFSRY